MCRRRHIAARGAIDRARCRRRRSRRRRAATARTRDATRVRVRATRRDDDARARCGRARRRARIVDANRAFKPAETSETTTMARETDAVTRARCETRA
jgi:hypothetical protein